METKVCPTCGKSKGLDEFYFKQSGRNGTMKHCKKCFLARKKVKNTPEYRRWYRYRMTIEQYQELLNSQGGRCATCGIVPEKFYVDHDHACCPGGNSCGQCVRGLLCFNCNNALGQVKDNPAVLLAMVDYLVRGVI